MPDEVKERPILFSARLVRAILAGTKTETRRVMKPQPEPCSPESLRYHKRGYWWPSAAARSMVDLDEARSLSPYGWKRGRLWVRETWAPMDADYRWLDGESMRDPWPHVAYLADGTPRNGDGRECPPPRWRPSIHMPRWASRILLELVEDVRIERLQDITAAGVAAEGVDLSDIEGERPGVDLETLARARFEALWDGVNAEREGCSWAANPWVWVVPFKVVSTEGGKS